MTLTQVIRFPMGLLLFAASTQAADLQWNVCPDDPLPGARGAAKPTWPDRGGECNVRQAPLDWQTNSDRKIDLFTARYKSENPRGRLIVLDGGPGNSGIDFAPGVSATLRSYRRQGWDLYIPMHRGVGHSTALSCDISPAVQSEPEVYAECARQLERRWGADLEFFSTQNAARDVCDLIGATADPQNASRAVVLGLSYGTFLAQHAMAACPERLSGAILDGTLPVSVNFDREPEVINRVGEAVLDLCRRNADCAAQVPSPSDAIDELFRRSRSGSLCGPAAQLDEATLRSLLGSSIGAVDAGPVIAMALVRRLLRCSPSDRSELAHLAGLFGSPDAASPLPYVFSPALSRHVLCQTADGRQFLSLPSLLRIEATARFATVPASSLVRNCATWPKQNLTPLTILPKTDLPVLMLQGRFDVSTPWEFARETAAVLNGPHQQFIEFPSGQHGLLLRPAGQPRSCVQKIVEGFLRDPGRRVDTSCVDEMRTIDFSGKSEAVRGASQFLFGTPEVWGK